MKDMVERVITTGSVRQVDDTDSQLLQTDPGNYQPVSLPSITSTQSLLLPSRSHQLSGPPSMISSCMIRSSRARGDSF